MIFTGATTVLFAACMAFAAPVGLPPVPVPADNPITPEKVKLGNKLFHDTRFSTTGEVSCATCHDRAKGFADGLPVSEGIRKLKGTRNAPTIINAAYLHTQFWDGREPSLESQSAQPFLNPVEMGLKDHEPILKIVRSDPEYSNLFDSGSECERKGHRYRRTEQSPDLLPRTFCRYGRPAGYRRFQDAHPYL